MDGSREQYSAENNGADGTVPKSRGDAPCYKEQIYSWTNTVLRWDGSRCLGTGRAVLTLWVGDLRNARHQSSVLKILRWFCLDFSLKNGFNRE